MFFLNIMPSGNMYVSRFSKTFAQRLQKTQKKIWPLCSTKTIFIIIAFVCEWVGAVVCDMVMKSWTITLKIGTAKLVSREQFCLAHSNDSHQCHILAADFVIFYYGIENEQAIQAGAGSE